MGALGLKKASRGALFRDMGRNIQNIKDLCVQIGNQLAGRPDENLELIPEYGIIGNGILYCYEYTTKNYIPIARGQKVFIIDIEADFLNRVLIYTSCARIIKIDFDELIYTECD